MKKQLFTILELLVVIGIIAILAAILMPALLNARAKAKAITCVNRQKQIATSFMLYADDFDSYAYSGSEWATGMVPEAIVMGYRATGQLAWNSAPFGQGYLRQEESLFCPETRVASLTDAITYGSTLSPAVNTPFTLTTIGTIQNPHQTGTPLAISFKKYIAPSNSVLGGDSGRINSGKYEHYSAIIKDSPHITMRHKKRANIFMADGHVENVGKKLQDYYFFNYRGSSFKDDKFSSAIRNEVQYNLD